MNIDLTLEEEGELRRIADDDTQPKETRLLASVLLRVIRAAEVEADYRREQREQ